MAGELGLWITMHLIVIGSLYAYVNNKERESIFENSYNVTIDAGKPGADYKLKSEQPHPLHATLIGEGSKY